MMSLFALLVGCQSVLFCFCFVVFCFCFVVVVVCLFVCLFVRSFVAGVDVAVIC